MRFHAFADTFQDCVYVRLFSAALAQDHRGNNNGRNKTLKQAPNHRLHIIPAALILISSMAARPWDFREDTIVNSRLPKGYFS
jgi:hypothetical protein